MTWADTLAAIVLPYSVAHLLYVYAGYGWLLALLAARRPAPVEPELPNNRLAWPHMTVLLTVFNEEAKIARRLDNLLAQDYPVERLTIVVASDGSTDGTEAIVEDYAGRHPHIRLVRSGGRKGKSQTQNIAMRDIEEGIVALTDADTEFEADYLRRLAAAFQDPQVGCVTAQLRFRPLGSDISANQGYYWRYELRLRTLESRLGILAVASGQAMAVRRECFRELPPDVGDDCIIPLDVVLAGRRVVHATRARAVDVMEGESEREFHSRVRMTLRNWVGTWRRPALLNPLAHPGHAFALWSHKLLRWLGGPVFWAGTASGLWLACVTHPAPLTLLPAVALPALTVQGWRQETGRSRRRVPGAGTLFSFVLANAGFTAGLWRAWRGQRVVTYRSGRKASGAPDA